MAAGVFKSGEMWVVQDPLGTLIDAAYVMEVDAEEVRLTICSSESGSPPRQVHCWSRTDVHYKPMPDARTNEDDLDVVGLDVKDIGQFAFEMESQVELVRMLTSQSPQATFFF
jgi:hypothetical protein